MSFSRVGSNPVFSPTPAQDPSVVQAADSPPPGAVENLFLAPTPTPLHFERVGETVTFTHEGQRYMVFSSHDDYGAIDKFLKAGTNRKAKLANKLPELSALLGPDETSPVRGVIAVFPQNIAEGFVDMVEASNAPTPEDRFNTDIYPNAEPDTHGGRHEEGGVVVLHPDGAELAWTTPGPTVDPNVTDEVPLLLGWSTIQAATHQPSIRPETLARLDGMGLGPAQNGGLGVFYTEDGDAIPGPLYDVHIHPSEGLGEITVQGRKKTVWADEAQAHENRNLSSGTTLNFGSRKVFQDGPSNTDRQTFAARQQQGFGPGGARHMGSYAIMIEAHDDPAKSTVYFYDASDKEIGTLSLGDYLQISQR